MGKLVTPFGEINILIDGKPVPYSAQEVRKQHVLCPHVLGRYQITVPFIPDGKAHAIACVFEPDCSYERNMGHLIMRLNGERNAVFCQIRYRCL